MCLVSRGRYKSPEEDFLMKNIILLLIFSSYYVAHVGDVRPLLRARTGTTITIGNNVETTDMGGTTFTNPPIEVGEDYYVFIRLYSSIDVSQT
jgi:hypothetical protein